MFDKFDKFDKELYSEMDYEKRYMVALEAFLRRVSIVNMPFALKGSLLTRQYFPSHIERYVDDLDFFYMEKIFDVAGADNIFTNWMCKVTTQYVDDGIEFRDFRENTFWRMIDYAMDDDFPTVNTDIDYNVTDIEEDGLCLDISFNLDINTEFIPLMYKPIFGDEFVVPYTIPLPVQIAWKLHQTIIRPRYKDLYDLKFLISHPSYDSLGAEETLKVLADECRHDKTVTEEKRNIAFAENITQIHKKIFKDYFWIDSEWKLVPEDISLEVIWDLGEIMQKAGLTDVAFQKHF